MLTDQPIGEAPLIAKPSCPVVGRPPPLAVRMLKGRASRQASPPCALIDREMGRIGDGSDSPGGRSPISPTPPPAVA